MKKEHILDIIFILFICIWTIVLLLASLKVDSKEITGKDSVFEEVIKETDIKTEKELIRKCIYKLKPDMKNKDLTNIIVNSIIKYKDDLDIKLIIAIMFQESRFNPKAIGGNDCGLLQVNIWYHSRNYKVSIEDLLNPEINIRVGLDILKNIIEQRKPQGYKYPYAFYNTSALRIYDDKGNLIGGRIMYIRHIEKHLRKIKDIK
jgi:hypothetical protein